LVNVDSGATSGIGAIDGLTVAAVTPDSLVDAHAPGLADATVSDPGILDGIGGDNPLGGDGITVAALGDNLAEVNGQPLLGDALGGSGIPDGLLGGNGIVVEALNGDNTAEVHAPSAADVTVSGAELANLGDGLNLGGLTGGGSDGITAEALNGDNIAEAHASGVGDATVGGAELGQILGGIGLDGAGLGGIGGDAVTVDAFNGDNIADAHVPSAADATVGSDLGGSSLLDVGNIVG
jgi:hypothetical protein